MDEPEKQSFNKENDEQKVKKIVITSYEVTDGTKTMRFEGENVSVYSPMNDDDWDILAKGVVKVAENGKLIDKAIEYLGTIATSTVDSSSIESVDKSAVDQPAVKETANGNDNVLADGNDNVLANTEPIVKNSTVTVQDVKDILNEVKDLIKPKEGDKEGFDIESSEDEKLKPIIEALKLKIGEKPTDPKILIEKAISDLTEEDLQPDQTATSIAVELVTNATVADEVVGESENEEKVLSDTKKTDIEDIKDVLKRVKKYIGQIPESPTYDDIKIEDTDTDIAEIVKYLHEEYGENKTLNKTLNILELLDNAIAAVAKNQEEATKNILEDADEVEGDSGDLNVNKALAFVKNEIAKSSSESSVDDTNPLGDDPDNGRVEADAAKKAKVEDILKAAKDNIEKDDKSTEKYKIKESYKDEVIDLNPILEAVNDKITDENKKLNLTQLLDNAIAKLNTDDYKLPENSDVDIAVELINEVDDQQTTAKEGGKPNKYVYGGKTVRAYPKNISFSKKNPAKKRQNKKTIRKLQKLMNKLK
jgi:hypothetical protein